MKKYHLLFILFLTILILPSAKCKANTIFIGDANVAQIQNDLTDVYSSTESEITADENGIWITSPEADKNWIKNTAYEYCQDYIESKDNHIVIIPPYVDSDSENSAEEYIEILKDFKETFETRHSNIYITSAIPSDKEENTNLFNQTLKEKLPEGIHYIDIATPLTAKEQIVNDTDFLDKETNQLIYQTIKSGLKPIQNTNGIEIGEEEDTSWLDQIKLNVYFEPNGGEGDTAPQIIDFNDTIKVFPTLKKLGYEIDHWEGPDGTLVTTETPITTDLTVTAIWKPSDHTPIKVIQKTEQLDGTMKETSSYTAYGTTDNYVRIKPNSLEGFETPEEKTVFVNADGSSTETFEYRRKSYKLSLKLEKGVISKQKKFLYKYQEPVTLKLDQKPFYDRVQIKGYKDTLTFKMPAKNLSLTASAVPTKYKIRYKGFGIYANDLKQYYTIKDLPFALGTPKTVPFVTFIQWTYDKQPIREIKNMEHTEITVYGKVRPNLFVLILPTLIIVLIVAWTAYYHTNIRRRRKHEQSLF